MVTACLQKAQTGQRVQMHWVTMIVDHLAKAFPATTGTTNLVTMMMASMASMASMVTMVTMMMEWIAFYSPLTSQLQWQI